MSATDSRTIVHCPACGAANRIAAEARGSPAARCGKCRAPLFARPEEAARSGETYKLRCVGCGARNRIPGARLAEHPRCGRCGAPLDTEALFAPQPVTVTDDTFEAQVLRSPLPVLLFAWAPWCTTCTAVAPVIDRFAAETRGRIRVGRLNVDQNPALAGRFNILSVPFLFVFDRGELQESLPGTLPPHELMMKMARYV